jgi:endonuclease YncB( thermonuclease family)
MHCGRTGSYSAESVIPGVLVLPRITKPAVYCRGRQRRCGGAPIPSGSIQVLDGDTIGTQGKTVRLVGFDTPEGGMNARCESERSLAASATSKLRQLVAAGGLELTLKPCAFRGGTEGTQACNYGRACGVLTAAGKDVAGLLIADGLAKPFHCSRDRCPRREPWC